ncbi:MAG: NifB/NifX family molybdenum-iron cluster-binding protein [Dehalococcoidia bacterium]
MIVNETRVNNPRSGSGNGQGTKYLPINAIVALISGREAIITARFGIEAYNELMKNGIHPFQAKDTVEEVTMGYLNCTREPRPKSIGKETVNGLY